MIYKYIKCESVIAKIMADANMSQKNIRITDIREWIFEAVEKIGASVQYIQRESGSDGVPTYRVEDYQVPIPEDLEKLDAVAWSNGPEGPWLPCRSNEQTFKTIRRGRTIQEQCPVFPESECIPPVEKPPITRAQVLGQNRTQAVIDAVNQGRFDEPTYFIKPGWVVLNKQSGFVKLSYKAIATDERGYPLIPDLASYQEAIYWYVMMKLSFPKFLKGSLGGKARFSQNTYFYIQKQWDFYRNQAYAEAMMPDEGQMRSIKNEWTKLVPEWDSDDTLYENLGSRQLNFNDYYHGY